MKADSATTVAPRSEHKNEEQAEFLKQKLREVHASYHYVTDLIPASLESAVV